MKLKTLLQITEWISHAPAINRSPDDKLRATPGGFNDGSPNWNDEPNWDGVIEGKDWFCYMESNNWETKRSGASIYINEDEKPHKIWIKIKTHGLRKPNDTNESYKDRIRKHTNKIARKWMSEAKRLHKPELNEVGNEIPISWKESFKNSIGSVKSFISEWGESEIDPINFTCRK